MRLFKVKVLLWPFLLVIVLAVVSTGAAFALGGLNALALGSLFSSSTSERDSQVIQSVTRQQEVSLLSLHIEGIDRVESNGKVFGVDIPASEKTTLIQYRFDAKLGIDGSQVDIEAVGPGAYRVLIPEFVGIGFDDPVFEDPIESSNPLSWLAPPAVQTQVVNRILSDENKQEYIDQNVEALRDQAKAFYSGLIASVDPEASVVFEFAG